MQLLVERKADLSQATEDSYTRKRQYCNVEDTEFQENLKYRIISMQDDLSESKSTSRRALSKNIKIDSLFRLCNMQIISKKEKQISHGKCDVVQSALIISQTVNPNRFVDEQQSFAEDNTDKNESTNQIVDTMSDAEEAHHLQQQENNCKLNDSMHVFQSPPPMQSTSNIVQNTVYFINNHTYDLKKNRDDTTRRIQQAISIYEEILKENSSLGASPLVVNIDKPLDSSITQYYVKRSYQVRQILQLRAANPDQEVIFHDTLNDLEYKFVKTLGKGSYGFAVLSQLNQNRFNERFRKLKKSNSSWIEDKVVVLKIGFNSASIQYEVLILHQLRSYLIQMRIDEYIDRYNRHFFSPVACYNMSNASFIVMQYAELGKRLLHF